jgi:hypothetical protein
MTLRLNIEIALKWHMKRIVDKIELFYPQDKNLNLTVHLGFTFNLNFFVKNIPHNFEFWKLWNKILENCYLMTRETLKKHNMKKFQNKNVFPFKIFFCFSCFFSMRSSSCWKIFFFSLIAINFCSESFLVDSWRKILTTFYRHFFNQKKPIHRKIKRQFFNEIL